MSGGDSDKEWVSGEVSGKKWVGFVTGASGSASCSIQWSYMSL